MKRDYANYQVALKLFLKRGNKILFLKLPESGLWDLPGGRIDNVETHTPLRKILAREIREELGVKVKYELGKPLFQFRRKALSRKTYNLLTVYEGRYLSGEIKLSSEHASYEWINPKAYKFKEKDFMSKEEYLAFIEYFSKYY
ncbi:hypothetical protein A2Z63_00110 [Candidatus Giovannonibacteria bacterium RIFCSPLOWO2_02_44_8]|uniref:Nudix hydrolase domain-containing protein n=3 Tax=Candidatus Giovannoniibacteriota TaxID=1752738 RepID=A0A1F5XCD3_9BACT|nr:MAG: hypothetical protein UW71_C0029G0001 [Parcubacteria group bacterium GW2011_GWB1_44_7]OGF73806.1 MAG: hypothetical protein A2W57_01505 [Candidatus Giovannonibacteria bacterium RIFCSPHIGHO2_02_43_16]OGF85510.1 MAG: hypothetical protein A2Z63_00110 [Candidatus Giovannonibacteria bacterium RIFCSPLOWO2_02_44_8]OGF95584.1 MAG: hypothetical protein A2Y47_01535 [Candidatus Giovannonibacteria bacterium RIFCSPLOWO2_12_43_8]